jgi:hypothetical protein
MSPIKILDIQIESDLEDLKNIPYLGGEYVSQEIEDLSWWSQIIKDKHKQKKELWKYNDIESQLWNSKQ